MFCIIWDNVIIALETFKYVTFLSDIWFIGRFGELHFACVFVCVCVCVCVSALYTRLVTKVIKRKSLWSVERNTWFASCRSLRPSFSSPSSVYSCLWQWWKKSCSVFSGPAFVWVNHHGTLLYFLFLPCYAKVSIISFPIDCKYRHTQFFFLVIYTWDLLQLKVHHTVLQKK